MLNTDARKRSVEGDDARGVDGAGKLKVKLWTVDAGCSVDAMISTSRVNESCVENISSAISKEHMFDAHGP